MKHILYLDLPQIPESLILSQEQISNLKRVGTDPRLVTEYFFSFPVNSELEDWCRENICNDFEAVRYQMFIQNVPMHKDAGNRLVGLNYNLLI